MISKQADMRCWVSTLIAVGLVAAGFTADVFGAATYGYTSQFEASEGYTPVGSVPGIPWSTAGTGVKVSSTAAAQGSQSCSIEDDSTLTLGDITDARKNVWVKMFVKPALYDDDSGGPAMDGDTTTSAALYVNKDRELYAYVDKGSGNGWLYVATLDSSAWYGFQVHLDYNTGYYDVYRVYGTDQTAVMDNLTSGASSHLKMATTKRTSLQSFSVKSGDLAYVDGVSVIGGGMTVAAGTATSPTVENPATITITSGSELGALVKYFGTVGSKLQGEAGDMLGQGVGVEGKIYVWNVTKQQYAIYEWGGSSWTELGSVGPAPAALVLTPLMGLWISPATGMTYPKAVVGVGAMAASGSIDVVGGGNWNFVQWPKATALTFVNGVPGGLGFEPASGDYLFIPRSNDSPIKLRWTGSLWKWYNTAYSGSLAQGKGFWILRAGGSTTFAP